jgi:hypothetical protein
MRLPCNFTIVTSRGAYLPFYSESLLTDAVSKIDSIVIVRHHFVERELLA